MDSALSFKLSKPNKEIRAFPGILLFCAGQAMADGLDTFLDNLNVQAAADRHGVVTSVGSYFGVPYSDVVLHHGHHGWGVIA